MKKKYLVNIGMICLAGVLLAGCKDKVTNQVASKDEMASSVQVGSENMTAITGDKIKDGNYEIKVESSSPMFKITHCLLTVKEGNMTALMTMSGTGYEKIFMGTGEDAIKAKQEEYIAYIENKNGEHTFQVPVEALDKELACAAFSIKKEKWYDRTLVFSSESLPADAIEGVGTTIESLSLQDGEYFVEVSLEGGSGRASVDSPAKFSVKNGKAYATIVWSSSNYDYMKVNGEKIEPISREECSVFEIPVSVLDYHIAVVANTIAMSEPHELDYTLFFDSKTLKEK